jgi:hypothetical protein
LGGQLGHFVFIDLRPITFGLSGGKILHITLGIDGFFGTVDSPKTQGLVYGLAPSQARFLGGRLKVDYPNGGLALVVCR